MTAIKAHYGSKVVVLDEPVSLPNDQPLNLMVAPVGQPPMIDLLKVLDQMPHYPSTPAALAFQHHHYLHGLPKRS